MKLIQDSGSPKKKVEISESELISHLKSFFKWKTNVTLKRLYSLGSSDYNKFIDYLDKKGFNYV